MNSGVFVVNPLEGLTIPDEWQPTLLSEVLRQETQKAKLQPGKYYTTLGVRWYAAGPFKKESLRGDQLRANCLYQVKAGDFIYNRLFAWKGSFGVIPNEMDGCFVSSEFPTFKADYSRIAPEFLWRWFSLPLIWRAVEHRSTGTSRTSRLRFKEEDFLNVCVPLPPLSEQRAIAHVLRTVQQAKEATEKVIAAIRQLKASLTKHLFTYGPIPFDQAGKIKLKETEIGSMPEHWEAVCLKDLVLRGRQTDPRTLPENFKYIDVSSVSNATFKITSTKSYLGKDAPSRAKKKVQSGDVIFATVRPYLKRVAIIPPDLHEAICSTAFCVLRASTQSINPAYLFFAVSSDSFVSRVSERQRGSSYPAVTDRDVLSTMTNLPPLSEQEDIASTLTLLEKKNHVEDTRLQTLRGLFDSLLHHLMTGRIRVTDFQETPNANRD